MALKLSEDLDKWRCERPDEWTMDRFIKAAKKLEEYLEEIAGYSCDCQECAQQMSKLAREVLSE